LIGSILVLEKARKTPDPKGEYIRSRLKQCKFLSK
jgi:hypothetical protein